MAGNNLFKAKIAEKIAKAMGPLLLQGTLVRITYAAVNPSDMTAAQVETPVNHTFRGIFDYYSARRMGGTAIQEGARVVILLAETITPRTVPLLGDKITLEGVSTEIVGPVVRDPDAATYIAEVKA
jgi:hypothetical protein